MSLVSAFRTSFVLVALAALASAGTGCAARDASAPEESGDEQALTSTKTLAKNVSSPSGLAVAGSYVYFGSNHLVASGDPELDQEMAYWEGKFSRVPLTGGRAEKVEDIGPITRVKVVGSTIYYAMADGCWIGSRNGSANGAPKQVYGAPDAECNPDGRGSPIAGFDGTAGALYVVKSNGDVLAGGADGSGIHKIGAVPAGNSVGAIANVAIADGALYVTTQKSSTDAQANPPKAALYRVALPSGNATKVTDLESSVSELTSDGKNLYWVSDASVMLLAAGSHTPKAIASGFGQIYGIAVDGTKVYVADGKRGAVYQVEDALGTPKRQRKLVDAKGVQALTVSGGTLYIGSHVIEGRKVAGIIGAIKLTP